MVTHTARALCLLLIAACAFDAEAISTNCLTVPSAASDTSASGVQFMKNGTVHDQVCPGMTYKVYLTFPTARTWQVVSTKGAFQGVSSGCTNKAAGTAATKVVDTLKLYIGCAATGQVKVSVLSQGASDAAMLLKTVSKPIKALSACPLSPCVQQAASSPSPAPAASSSTGAVNMTGNPMVDMMSMFSMLYGASGVGSTPLGLVLNYKTALTVISGLSGLKDKGIEAATALKTVQSLLAMVPASSDSSGFLSGMKNFLGAATNYLPTSGSSNTATQQMSGAVLDAVSAMATMGGLAVAGNTNSLASMIPMLNMMNSVTTLMNLLPTTSAVVNAPVVGGSSTAGTAPMTTTTTTTTTDPASTTTTTPTTTATTDPASTTTPTTTTTTTTDPAAGTTTTPTTTTTTDPAAGTTTTTTTDPAAGTTTSTTTTTDPASTTSSGTTDPASSGSTDPTGAGR